jgi:hypothetical protein
MMRHENIRSSGASWHRRELLWFVIVIGILVIHIMCIVKGVNGQRFVPYVGSADKFRRIGFPDGRAATDALPSDPHPASVGRSEGEVSALPRGKGPVRTT